MPFLFENLIFYHRELLDRVRNFENEQFANKKSKNQAPKLEPVNDSGGTMLLREVDYFDYIKGISGIKVFTFF